MREVERIADQLRRSQEGDAWHGPALCELLAGVSAVQAAAKPPAVGHCIGELVGHIAAWEEAAVRWLAGEMVTLTPDQDWPPLPAANEPVWRATVQRLEDAEARLRQAILAFDDGRLSETVPGKNFSYYGLLHGVVQHNLYHAGQIALLKKLA